jgi:hypothetical protein
MSAQDPKLETTVLVPVDRTALAKFSAEWRTHLTEFADVPCTSDEEAAWWTAWRNSSHDALTAQDTERKETTGPLYTEFTTINGWYKEESAPALEFKKLANEKLSGYALAQEAAAKAAREAAQLAAQTGDDEAVYEALSAIPNIEKAEGSSTRFGWEPTVVDFAQLDDAYKLADTKKLKAFAALHGKSDVAPVLAGVTFARVAKSQPTGSRK